MDLSGTPGPELLAKIQSVHAQNYIKTLEKRRPKDFSEVFRPCSPLVRIEKKQLNTLSNVRIDLSFYDFIFYVEKRLLD